MAIFIRDKSFYRTLARLAVPIALKNLITLSVGLADNVMVGSLGEAAISGAYMANQPTNLLQTVVADVATAMTILATQYWGKRETEPIKRIVGVGFKISMLLAIAAFTMGFFFTETTLRLYTPDAAIIAEGAKYLKIISVGYLFFCATETLVASMRCVESVRIGLVLSCSTFVINIGLNYILIFGKLGFEPMGIRGAAIATLTARIAEFILISVYVRVVDKKLRMKFRELIFSRAGVLFKDFLRYGIPVIMGGVVWGLNMNVQAVIIGHLDSIAATSSITIANTVFSILTVLVYGTSAAAAIIIGKTVGEGKVELVKQYAKTLQMIFFLFGLVSGSLIFCSRYVVGYIWNKLDAETIAMVKQFLLVLSVTSIGSSYQACTLTGIVRAGGATSFVFRNDLFWVWCVVIPSAAVAAFVFHAEPVVVFALLKGDQIYKCAVAVIKTNRFKWIKTLTRESDELAAQKEA